MIHSENNVIHSQRLDVWLWHARLSKTRNAGNKLIRTGLVYVNSCRIVKPAHSIKLSDIITLPKGNMIKVIEIRGFSSQRVAAKNCPVLYKEIIEK